MNEQRKEYTLEESANWISYNLKRIADILEQHTGYQKPHRDNNQNKGNWGNNNNNNNSQF